MKQSTFSAVMANSIKNLLQRYTKGIRFTAILTLLFTIGVGQMWGADVTYTVTSTTAVSTSGTEPTGSSASYTQTYSTAGQITSGKYATLTLTNLGGINISNITLSMKSNKSSGAGKLSYSTDDGSTWTYLVGSSGSGLAFNNASWNGSYTQTYTDISKTVSLSNVTKLKIKIEATTNSLYCQSYKITYTTSGTKVTLTKGYVTNGSISLDKSEVTTTSAAQSVTVTCTPNTGYYTKSVSATKPATGNTPTYGGSGNSRTVTYSKGSNGSSTITATFSPQWQLRGTFNNWGTTHPLTSFSGNIATVTVDLQAMTEYTFKFVNVSGSSEQWYGNTGAIITDISNWEFSTSIGDNARLYTGPAGTYTFKFNVSTKALQVIYPTVTHPAEGYAYFQKQDSWDGFKVYNYTSDSERLSDWPGSPSVTNTTTICGKTYYYTALATQFENVIFRDNGSNQWKEISVSGYSGKYCGDDYNATPQTWKTFNKYSITFNSNGGSGTMSTISGICPGDNQTLPANTFTRTGYTFDGWATSANGNNAYNDKATISINSNITLYARWKANIYTITSNLTNCSSSPEIPTSYTYTGSAANLTYTITPESGYRLPDAITVSGCTYTWNKTTGQLELTGMISGNVTITIKAVKVYNITWKVNKQTYTTGGPTTSVDEGSTYKNLTLPTPPPADNTLNECYPGKKFVGWSTTNIGSTESSDKPTILFKTAAEAPNTAITDNTTLYAVFATESHTTSTSTKTTAISGAVSGTITNVLSWSSAKNDGTATTAWNTDGHFRLYPNKNNGNGSSITITPVSGITIDEVVLTATSTTYAKPVKYNIDGGSDVSGTWNGTKMTISDINATSSFKFRNAHTGANNDQLRVTVSVTYLKEITSTETSNYVTECCTLNNINLDNSGTTTGGTFSAEANNACKGEEITLSAKAENCYAFDSWTIKKTLDGSDVTNSVLDGNTLTMPDYAVTVYATFKSLSVTEIALAMTGGHQDLDVGDTNQLLVTYTPANATCDKAIVSWTSSDDNVMSVTSDGLVEALRAGTATITATTEGGVTATYTITVKNPTCDSWYIHYWNNSTSGDECFYKVKPDDPNDHEWRTGNFSLPSFSDEDKFIVNNTPEDPYKKDQVFRTGIGFADIQRGGQNCGTNPYPGQDAYGQLSIYDDSETDNRYIAFYPAQYLVTYGKEGAAPWEVLPLNNTTGYEYETEPFMVPNGYKTDDTYKYYVGIIDKNGNIKHVGYEFGGVEYKKSSVDAMNTVNGLSADDMAGKWGTWHIYSNSCANNWYCEFIHYYRVDFNLNGGEGDFAPRYGKATTPYVEFTTTDIGVPTRTGYTFLGWKDQNNKIYAPTDATVTINKDLTLTALWIEEYGSTNCRWEEVTIDDIEYGDEVVIAMEKNGSTYALADNNTAATSAPSATEISINANKTINTDITNISTSLIWNIDYDKEGTKNLVIYSTKNVGKWLYSTNANDGVRIGTNANKEFKIVEGTGDDAGNFFLYHIAQSRYLGVYVLNHDWRGYTSINIQITGQTLKFYKKVCLPEGHYRVTWDANGGAWSDGSTTKEEVYAEGATINKPDKPKRDGYEFTEWDPNPTTMPDANTTFTAQWAEVCTVTYTVGNGDTAPTEMQAEENTDIILPAFTTNLTCVKFVGWTDAASGYTHGTDNLYKAGNSYTVTENVTLHAVYAAGGGYVLVTDVANLAVGDKVIIVSAIADGDSKFWALSTTQNNNNRGQEEVQIIDNTIEPSAGVQILTLETGTQTGTFAFNTGDGYLYAASSSSNYLKTQTTNNANGSWTIEIDNAGVATIKAQGTYTRDWLRYNGGNDIFSCYATGQSDVSIYKESITGYTTDPECEEYDITLEVIGHANGSAKINGQTATPTTSQTVTILNTKMATISDVANVAGYDVTVSKRSGYATFTDNGNGTWTVSEPASNVTIQVQYTAKQIYKVQFVTGTGGTGSFTSLDAYKGQTVTIPANYEAFGLCGEFVGWTEGARASGEKPTKLYQPGDPFTLNSNGTSLYAVYSISASCTSEFALGKSGDYEMYAIYSNNVYYVTQKNGTYDYFYANTEADIEANARVKSTFRMQYDATQTAAWNEQDVYAYTIYISNGSTEYGFWHLNSMGDLDFDPIEPYYWKVKSYNGGYDIYGEANGRTYRITCNGSNFNARTSADAVYFTPGGGIEYWTDIDCSDINVDVTFAWNQFESWPVGMPNANSYKGLAKCSEITEFPIALQEGWTFLGWSTKEYNALHADDLDDENNASRAYPDGSDIYKTGGNTLTLGSADITLYPVFTRYEENEPLNLVNGGEFYMYVKPGNTDVYGGVRRFYIADVNLSSGGFTSTEDCNDARPFTFIKEDAGWLIQFVDEGGKTYYLGANAAASDLTKHQTSKTYWDITVGTGNNPANAYRMMAIGQGSEDALLAKLANGLTSATFKYYAIENLINTPSVYFDIFLGSCEDRIFSSDPTSKPSVTITGGGYVTGSKGQTVFVPSAFTITGKNLNDNYNVNIADVGGLLKFYNEAGNVISDFGKPLGGKLAQTTFYVAYTPTADTDGTEIPSIIVTNGTGGSALNQEITGLIHARHLPAEFAIVAKIGGNWYALPDTALHVQTPEGLLVEVDNVDSPTAVTQSFCNATAWSLRGVKNTRYVVNSVLNGDNVLFAETNTEVIDNRKMLYAGEDSKVGAYATYTNYTATNPDRYEWQLTTTDNITYTVNSNSTIVSDPLSVNNSRAFGTHGKFVASEEIRLLPIEGPCIAPAVFQVIEWKTNGMIIMYTGAGVSATTQVGTYAASDAQMTEVDHGVYELTTSQDLTACTGLKLAITFTDASSNKTQKVLVIPAIVSGEKGSTSLVASNAVAKVTDVVVLDDAKLTADGTQYTYNDVVVYPGGNLVIDTDGKLGMYTLTLRAGSSWGAEEYEHKYPQFLLRGDYSNTSAQINLDYVTTQDYYYPLSVPEEVTIDDIKYPVDIYGSNVDKANTGSFRLKYYNGAQRATGATGWVVLDENNITKLSPNSGYAFWGIPKKVSVNGAADVRQTYGIHRIPIKIAADKLHDNEINPEEVTIQAYAAARPNDQGWNYLGNPYLVGLGSMDGSDEDLIIGLLEKEMVDGKWTGGWVYNEESVNNKVRYITITNDCQNFVALPVADAKISPFTTFFIQAASEDDQKIRLTAPASVLNVSSLPARHYAAQQETAKEITTGIILTGNDQTDRTGLLIADNFTEEYDFNADLSKFENSGINLYTIGKTGNLAYMAINQALAEQPIPVGYSAPAEGLYTIAFDEDRYNATDISALYLIDYDSNEKTNLLHTDYSFVTAAGTNNQRFALQVAFIPQNATSVEWVDDATIQVAVDGNNLLLNNLPTDAGVQVFDALGRVIYATPNAPTEMQITLPTGYYLVRIADKQHAVVINTIIP